MEIDPRIEYKLAYINLDQRSTNKGPRTTSTQVILKRVRRDGAEQLLHSRDLPLKEACQGGRHGRTDAEDSPSVRSHGASSH